MIERGGQGLRFGGGGGCLFDEFHGEQVRQSFRSDGLVRSWVEGGGGGLG